MANRIRGITIEIGGDTTKLDKALAGTNKTLSQTQRDLKDVEKLLKMKPGNADLIAQKQRLLAEAMEASAEKADTLRDALQNADTYLQRGKDYQAAYEPLKTELDAVSASLRGLEANAESMQQKLASGQISTEQYDAFARKLEDTRKEADNLRAAIQDVNQQFSGAKWDQSQYDAIQRELIETEQGLESFRSQASKTEQGIQDLGDEARNAAGDLGNLDDSAGNIGEGFTIGDAAIGTFIGNGLSKLVDVGLQALDTLWNLDEATEEYRESMGLLTTAYETAGLGAETADAAYRGFYQILGDTGQATEAAQLLSQLATSEEEVAEWTKVAAGVYGTFGESLPIESLIEAANETAKTGEVTGALADALNWVGLSEEAVNEQMNLLGNETDRSRYLMSLLSRTYSEASDSFYENNEALIASRDTQADMDESTAALGESVANLKTTFFEAFGPTLTRLLDGAATILERLSPVIELIADALGWLIDKIIDAIEWLSKLFTTEKEVDTSKLTPELESDLGISASSVGTITKTRSGIPALATGGLIPPNNPFLAVLGDNRTETEIVSPYSTIKQATREAMAEGGFGGAGQLTIVIKPAAGFTRNLSYALDAESQRRGVRLVKG